MNYMVVPGLSKNAVTLEKVMIVEAIEKAKEIRNGIGLVYGFTLEQLKGRGRKAELVMARQIGMYIIKSRFQRRISLHKLGHLYRRDHATVLYAVQHVVDLMDTDASYKRQVDKMLGMYG